MKRLPRKFRFFTAYSDASGGRSFVARTTTPVGPLSTGVSGFAIDCLTYTLLSNHLHLVLGSRPDVVSAWSDEEVARRWLRS